MGFRVSECSDCLTLFDEKAILLCIACANHAHTVPGLKFRSFIACLTLLDERAFSFYEACGNHTQTGGGFRILDSVACLTLFDEKAISFYVARAKHTHTRSCEFVVFRRERVSILRSQMQVFVF